MTSSSQFSGRKRVAALAAATTGLVATTGMLASPAQSAPTSQCPSSYAVADLTKGDPVTGLTVTSGTDPDSFGGTVVGVLENGIGPGVDMILVDLTSDTIDRVGIWSGMSGSPVYADDGELIGAVSYSLGLGPSTIAGVTPAAEMQKLLRDGGQASPVLQRTVTLPQSLRRTLATTGAVASATAPASMTQMQVPVTVSGLSGQRRASAAKVLRFGGAKMADAAGGPTSSESIGIAAGGNLAASMSYGTVTAAGVGTATAVCGDEILAFGHPMNYSGPSSMALHGARATHIQDDQTLSGFKSANIGAPIGTVDADRLAGLHALTGALPAGIPFTAVASDNGGPAYTASSQVVTPEVLADIGFANTLAAQDKVMDRIGKGSSATTWTIKGLRKDGTPFTFARHDMYSDPSDISGATAFALVGDLQAIVENPGEAVTITSVDSSTRIIDDATTYVVQKVQVLREGTCAARRPAQPPASGSRQPAPDLPHLAHRCAAHVDDQGLRARAFGQPDGRARRAGRPGGQQLRRRVLRLRGRGVRRSHPGPDVGHVPGDAQSPRCRPPAQPGPRHAAVPPSRGTGQQGAVRHRDDHPRRPRTPAAAGRRSAVATAAVSAWCRSAPGSRRPGRSSSPRGAGPPSCPPRRRTAYRRRPAPGG